VSNVSATQLSAETANLSATLFGAEVINFNQKGCGLVSVRDISAK
jgi:hypothetical protein